MASLFKSFVLSLLSVCVKPWTGIYVKLILIIWSSCYNTSVTGQQVIGSTQPVMVIEGDDVILPCHIQPPVNMERRTVEWIRPDLKPAQYVYLLQDGRHITDAVNPLYKRRTSLFAQELQRGNISLKLSRVKLSDEGKYTCFVPDLGRLGSSLILVGSGSHPVISSNGPTDGGVSLSCDSGCWYPQPEMSWLDGDGTLLSAGPSVTETRPPHCYDVQRNVTVRTAGHVTCRVHLTHINHTVETRYIPERDIPTDGGSTGYRGRTVIVIPVIISIMVAAVLLYLYWNQKILTLTGEEETRRDKASKLRGLLERTSGYHHITDYEEELQGNMDKTFISVKLGTGPVMDFKNIFIPLYNVDINVTDIHRHHEVRQMEMKKAGEEKEIHLSEMFKDPSGRNKRTVLTVGCAGIGKTFLVHKFIFDWAKKCFPQGPHLVFPLKFRQLNLLKGQKFSLAKLIHTCIKETRFIEEDILNHIFNELQKSVDYNNSPFKVMFVMDGYDENYFQFDFSKTNSFMDVSESYPVDVLLLNLLKGELLPSAHIWITSRPAAANQIPEDFVNRMTEVRGFIRDDQKKEFFMKMFRDENLASSIYSQIKESKILHTMCEIPVFCWILATVVQNMKMTDKLPKTMVEMYCYFLIGEIQREKMKNPALNKADKEKLIKDAGDVLLKLGRLAFDQLDEGNIIFYEKDLEVCGLDVNKDLQILGFCTTFFKEDDVFFLQTVYCFVHLSIQEFLAAVYLFHCFTKRNMKVLKTFLEDDDYNSDSSDSDSSESNSSVHFNSDSSLSDFLKAAMEKSLQSKSGHLDLFVRFLHGLSLESNQSLLGGLLGQTENSPEEIQRAINNLKKMGTDKDNDDNDGFSPDRCLNIFHCLMEMNDPSVSQGIQQFLEAESRSGKELSETQCSALASMLLMSEEVLEVLDLNTYNIVNVLGRQRLVPAVRNCTTARLVGCDLQKEHIEVVASALSSNPSHLRHLDLSSNGLNLNLLSLLEAALKSPQCRLETLRLINCWLSQRWCEVLASALSSNPSHLRELDVSWNRILDSGIELLCVGVKSPHCLLQTLRLSGCGITEEGCSSLASAVALNPSHLKHVDLSCNHPGGDAVQTLLSAGLETVNVNHGGEHWINPQLLTRYLHPLTLDPNTASTKLCLSEDNRKVTRGEELQSYPDHPDRFDDKEQVLCTEGLTGRCYWEVERSGDVGIGVSYRGISRRGEDSQLGYNDKSWSLYCSEDYYIVYHNSRITDLPVRHSGSNRVSVYLDWSAGTVSFYHRSSDSLTHLYTLQTTFTEPLYPGFWLWQASSVCLCEDR